MTTLTPTPPADVVDDLTRRELITGALAAGLLVACGRESTTDGTQAPPATRQFVDVTGRAVEIPVRPQRIVATHDFNAGAQLLSLGAPVVGIPTRDGALDPSMIRYFDVGELDTVGVVYEPNIEAIAALSPDLIVHEGFRGQVTLDDEVLDALREIAPVVGIDTFRPVEEVMADFALLVGGDAAARVADQEAELAGLVEELRGRLGERWGQLSVSYLNFGNGLFNTQAPGTVPALAIMERLGASFIPLIIEAGSAENGGFLGEISNERLPEFDADLILIGFVDDPTLFDQPLYQSLAAVGAGQTLTVPEDLEGNHYPNYLATARFLLDNLPADLRTDLR